MANRTTDENCNLEPKSATNSGNSEESVEVSSSVDWEKCILCQKVKKSDKDLRIVKSENMAAAINFFGKVDEELSIRIASGSLNLADLARYHLSCYNQYQGMLRKCSASVLSV